MNQDLILSAALKVGLTFELPPTKLLEFADLVRALEREECARVCDVVDQGLPKEGKPGSFVSWVAHCAIVIRSRK